MTRDDYYNMAVASGLWQSKPIYDTALMAIDLMRFVEMVAAVEREACAKVCDDQAKSLEDQGLPTMAYGARYSATAIRARGEKQDG
jgi:hypothetical protein